MVRILFVQIAMYLPGDMSDRLLMQSFATARARLLCVVVLVWLSSPTTASQHGMLAAVHVPSNWWRRLVRQAVSLSPAPGYTSDAADLRIAMLNATNQFTGSPQECAPGCEKHGNCNRDLGR
jgi:hypothetical protein